MTGVCRVGDLGVGVCPHHSSPQNYTTIFVSGIENVTSDDLQICVVGTIGVSTCGHPTIALTGSDIVTADGIGIHRVGDMGANYGPYTAVGGSDNVTSE